jgi:LAO/AO transport system kinase
MVENGVPGFEEVLAALHDRLGGARRIGVTGPPGSGKSTVIERLASHYRAAGHTVGVVAVDPSSPFTGGALLGDRIRMERAATDPGVFIRSMASRGSLGGMATTTGEVADVMDAFGFDRVLIETVGVGQSELDVASVADTIVVVLVPESGDGIQVMKAGLLEVADLFAVNKADRPGADRLRQELEVAIGLRRGQAFRHVPAHHGVDLSALSGAGVDAGPTFARGAAGGAGGDASVGRPSGDGSGDRAKSEAAWEPPVGIGYLAEALDRHFAYLRASGDLTARRARRLEVRTRAVVDRAVRRWLWSEAGPGDVLRAALADAVAGTASPYDVAARIVHGLRRSGDP